MYGIGCFTKCEWTETLTSVIPFRVVELVLDLSELPVPGSRDAGMTEVFVPPPVVVPEPFVRVPVSAVTGEGEGEGEAEAR